MSRSTDWQGGKQGIVTNTETTSERYVLKTWVKVMVLLFSRMYEGWFSHDWHTWSRLADVRNRWCSSTPIMLRNLLSCCFCRRTIVKGSVRRGDGDTQGHTEATPSLLPGAAPGQGSWTSTCHTYVPELLELAFNSAKVGMLYPSSWSPTYLSDGSVLHPGPVTLSRRSTYAVA